MRRLVFLTGALLVIPALALAGPVATDDNRTLQVKVGLSPAKASKKKGTARPVAAKYDLVAGTTDGSPIPDLRSVKVDLGGTVMGFDAFPKCTESKAGEEGQSACPKGSKVGQGSATAEIHLPTGNQDLKTAVTLYNGASDLDANGDPREPVDALLVYTEVAGAKIVIPMEATDGDKAVILRNPEEDEDPNALRPYAIKEIHLTIPQRTGKRRTPFVAAPRKCEGNWLASSTYDFYEGGPLTATHRIKCKKA